MSLYPATPTPQIPYVVIPRWKTITANFDNGAEQRKAKQSYAQFDMTLTYDVLIPSEFQTIWNFYNARKGSFEAFYCKLWESADYKNIYIATADGSYTTFDIPGYSTSARTLYVNGVSQGSGFNYLTGGGVEGSDRIQFSPAPLQGTILTIDFTGYLRNRCRFKDDQLSREMFSAMLFKTGLSLKGLNFL